MCALQAHKWDDAHKVAVTYMSESDIAMLYITQAQRLEAQHRFKDAEKLYLLVKEPDLAINMYKKNRQYDQMVRLVTTYRKDLLTETHLHLVRDLTTWTILRNMTLIISHCGATRSLSIKWPS